MDAILNKWVFEYEYEFDSMHNIDHVKNKSFNYDVIVFKNKYVRTSLKTRLKSVLVPSRNLTPVLYFEKSAPGSEKALAQDTGKIVSANLVRSIQLRRHRL